MSEVLYQPEEAQQHLSPRALETRCCCAMLQVPKILLELVCLLLVPVLCPIIKEALLQVYQQSDFLYCNVGLQIRFYLKTS